MSIAVRIRKLALVTTVHGCLKILMLSITSRAMAYSIPVTYFSLYPILFNLSYIPNKRSFFPLSNGSKKCDKMFFFHCFIAILSYSPISHYMDKHEKILFYGT